MTMDMSKDVVLRSEAATPTADPKEEDLGSLPLPDLAEIANSAAKDADQYASTAVEAALRCGLALVAAKGKVPHGQWIAWLETNFAKSTGTGQRYMRLAKDVNKARATFLEDSESLRDALRKIAGSKSVSKEDIHDQIAALLREGKTQKHVLEELHVAADAVKRIYETIVVPELLEIDWRGEIQRSLVKEMAIARYQHVIHAEYCHKQLTGGSAGFAASETRVSTRRISAAKRVIECGCRALVARCDTGEIAITTAARISQMSHDDQEAKLQTMDRKKSIDTIDDLRARVSLMVDQKLGWCREYGTEIEVFRDLRGTAEQSEVSEIVSNIKLVLAWAGAIVRVLGDDGCSQQTNEPKGS